MSKPRFKTREWITRWKDGEFVPTITLKMLREMLRRHHRNFSLHLSGWSRSDIEHFLEINHWLCPSHIQEFHVRTCYSVLKGIEYIGKTE